MDALAYSASVGVTTDVDMGAFVIPGRPTFKIRSCSTGLASADPFHMYDAALALHREKKMDARLRIFFLSMDTQPNLPLLSERLRNAFDGFGDDMLRISGIGEFATVWPLFGKVTPPPNYEAALQLVAKQGWPFQQHSLSLAEDQLTASTFEKVNAVTPIANLRWSIAHVPHIDQETVNRFKALGAGIAIHPFEYLAGASGRGAARAHDRRQRNSRGSGIGLGADFHARSVADDLLHGDWKECGGHAHQSPAKPSRGWRRCGSTPRTTDGSFAKRIGWDRWSRESWAMSRSSATTFSIPPRCRMKPSSASSPCSRWSAAR